MTKKYLASKYWFFKSSLAPVGVKISLRWRKQKLSRVLKIFFQFSNIFSNFNILKAFFSKGTTSLIKRTMRSVWHWFRAPFATDLMSDLIFCYFLCLRTVCPVKYHLNIKPNCHTAHCSLAILRRLRLQTILGLFLESFSNGLTPTFSISGKLPHSKKLFWYAS